MEVKDHKAVHTVGVEHAEFEFLGLVGDLVVEAMVVGLVHAECLHFWVV